MRRSTLLVVLGSLALGACDEDPARSVTIIARPPLPADQARRLAPNIRLPSLTWQPELCPPAEQEKGRGSFAVTGACSFEQTLQVSCIALGDDFFIELSRPAGAGATLHMFGNVERYTGPGSYARGNQLLISLRTDTAVYPWNAGNLSMTVEEGEQFVRVEPATLHPGYVRGASTLQVAGTLWCKAPPQRTTP